MTTPTLGFNDQSLASLAEVTRGARTLLSELRAAWKPHAMLQLCGFGVFVSGYAVSSMTGYLLPASPEGFAFKFVLVAALYVFAALLLVKCAKMIAFERPQHPIAELGRWFWSFFGDPKRLANGFHGMIFVFLLMGGFTMWKNQVARILSFSWDPTLESIDRWVHFGSPPHEWLMQVIGFPFVTAAINWNYLLWFHVLFIACFVTAFQTHRTFLRQRFFYALLLGWGIGGILFANLLSSAGPVFFGRVTGDERAYADLIEYLHRVNEQITLTTLKLQDFLWSAYQATPSYSTISAMPSMHVTIAVLIFIATLKINRWLACVTGLFALLILVGSVQLGWHYAIDGYLGIGVAFLSWSLAGPIARWDLQRSAE
jgi:hypothetical protein